MIVPIIKNVFDCGDCTPKTLDTKQTHLYIRIRNENQTRHIASLFAVWLYVVSAYYGCEDMPNLQIGEME